MNFITALGIAVVSAAGVSGGIMAAQGVAIDQHTNVPLAAMISAAVTVFIVGMWVSRKVTTFEINEASTARRLDVLDAKMEKLLARLERMEQRDK